MFAKQKISPMGNRILVKRENAQSMKGKILLPESAQKKPIEGTVIAVGPGKTNDKGKLQSVDIQVGDRILFSSYGGTEYTLDEIEYLILSEEDVLAVYH